MKPISKLAYLCSVLICSVALASTSASELDRYHKQIDYRCNVNADCKVKNIGNCCGYYPKCVNSRANVNPELVSSICQKEGINSICGYQEINRCECVQSQCVGSYIKRQSQ